MHKLIYTISALLLTLTAGLAGADTLELADGSVLEGDCVGSSNGIIMFNTGDDIEAYPESQVVGIFLSDGVATAELLIAAEDDARSVTAPAGTRLVIRMADDDQLYPIATETLAAQSGNEAGKSVGRTASAALGGLIDGSSGAKTGAKVGLGASILTGGSSINVPAGTMLETSLRTPLSID